MSKPFGLNLSAFIRMAVTQWMDRAEAERTAAMKGGGK
jgi:predicted DNA-binding ribbon-helix-helix protein